MANEPHSDRQRLLKLIDGDAATLKVAETKKKIADTSRKLKEFLFLAKERTAEALRRLRKGELSFPWPGSLPVNRILAVLLALMSVYLVVRFAAITLFGRGNVVLLASKYEAGKDSSFTELRPLGYYLDNVTGKDIFNPQRLSQAGASRDESPSAQLFAGFKLVGIDWGEKPVALIEDTQAGKTYFVKKGDTVKDIRVTDVAQDRVTIIYNNKMIELK
jgi:hypothetical protein